MTPESKVLRSIERALDKLIDDGRNIYYERRSAIGASFAKGLPDIWLVVDGRHLEVEVKAPGGKLSSAQIKWHERFNALSVPWVCVESPEELIEAIDRLTRS